MYGCGSGARLEVEGFEGLGCRGIWGWGFGDVRFGSYLESQLPIIIGNFPPFCFLLLWVKVAHYVG